MSVAELLRWQWDGYPRTHRARPNLLIHIVAVPMFELGSLGLVTLPFLRSWPLSAGSLVAMVVAMAAQGRGHGQEQVAPEPFTGPANALSRIFLEQWVTFPRFVLSGKWSRALRG